MMDETATTATSQPPQQTYPLWYLTHYRCLMCWRINKFALFGISSYLSSTSCCLRADRGSVILRVCLEIHRLHWGCSRVSCSRRELHAQTWGRTVVLPHHQVEGVSPKRIFSDSTAKLTETKPFYRDSPKITHMSEFSSVIATKRHIWPGLQDGADTHGQNVSGHVWRNVNWC